jgi:hypothetical protein
MGNKRDLNLAAANLTAVEVTNMLFQYKVNKVNKVDILCFAKNGMTENFINIATGRIFYITLKRTTWPESASELYRRSDRRLSAKLIPTFADRGYHVVSVTVLYSRNIVLLDRSRYFFFEVAP